MILLRCAQQHCKKIPAAGWRITIWGSFCVSRGRRRSGVEALSDRPSRCGRITPRRITISPGVWLRQASLTMRSSIMRKALKINPADPETHNNAWRHALWHRSRGRCDCSTIRGRSAISAGLRGAACNLANALIVRPLPGDLDGAIARYSTCLALKRQIRLKRNTIWRVHSFAKGRYRRSD